MLQKTSWGKEPYDASASTVRDSARLGTALGRAASHLIGIGETMRWQVAAVSPAHFRLPFAFFLFMITVRLGFRGVICIKQCIYSEDLSLNLCVALAEPLRFCVLENSSCS